MKIAVFAPRLIPTHPAGGQMLEVVRALSAEYEFTVFGRKIDRSLAGKVRFYQLPIPIIRPRLFTYIVQFLMYQRTFNYLRLAQKFDVVHSLEASSPVATVVTMQFCAAKVLELIRQEVLNIEGWRSLYYGVLYMIGSRMEQLAVTNSHLKGLVCVSQGLAREIAHYYKPPVVPTVIPNSINVSRFADAKKYRSQVRQQLGLNENQIVGVICALGDWERKGLGVLIDAVSLLRRDTVKIIVVGGGPIEEYKERCRKRRVDHNFIFIGFTWAVEKFYGAADFFIFPTAYEAWPIVALEAAASGLPLLITPVNGVEDFVENGVNGFLLDRVPNKIAEIVEYGMRNRRLFQRMGQKAQQKAQALFKQESMIESYRAFYKNMWG